MKLTEKHNPNINTAEKEGKFSMGEKLNSLEINKKLVSRPTDCKRAEKKQKNRTEKNLLEKFSQKEGRRYTYLCTFIHSCRQR